MTFVATTLDSPVGTLTLVASDAGLVAVLWPDDDPLRVRLGPLDDGAGAPILQAAAHQLGGYFAGERRRFDLPLDWRGTDFQKRVWAELLTIPYGETRSYGAIARAIGRPASVTLYSVLCWTSSAPAGRARSAASADMKIRLPE